MKVEKNIKAWAVIFPKSKDIYSTLSKDRFGSLSNWGQKAIFDTEAGAKQWKDELCREEPFNPKIIEIEIKII